MLFTLKEAELKHRAISAMLTAASSPGICASPLVWAASLAAPRARQIVLSRCAATCGGTQAGNSDALTAGVLHGS